MEQHTKILDTAPACWSKSAVASFCFGIAPPVLFAASWLITGSVNINTILLPLAVTAASALAGLATGIIGIVQARRRRLRGFWFGIAGLLLSFLCLCVAGAVVVLLRQYGFM